MTSFDVIMTSYVYWGPLKNLHSYITFFFPSIWKKPHVDSTILKIFFLYQEIRHFGKYDVLMTSNVNWGPLKNLHSYITFLFPSIWKKPHVDSTILKIFFLYQEITTFWQKWRHYDVICKSGTLENFTFLYYFFISFTVQKTACRQHHFENFPHLEPYSHPPLWICPDHVTSRREKNLLFMFIESIHPSSCFKSNFSDGIFFTLNYPFRHGVMHQLSILTPHICISYQFLRHLYVSAINSDATYMHQLSILTPPICISYQFWRHLYASTINSNVTYLHQL